MLLIKLERKLCKGKNLFDRLDVDKELEIIIQKNSELIELRKKEKFRADEVKETVEEKWTYNNWWLAKVELKVGKILECQPHPKADRLLSFKIDIGDEVRTIVSGIRKYLFWNRSYREKSYNCSNLKPVNLRGDESNGMILAASDDENLGVLTVLNDVKEGSEVS